MPELRVAYGGHVPKKPKEQFQLHCLFQLMEITCEAVSAPHVVYRYIYIIMKPPIMLT